MRSTASTRNQIWLARTLRSLRMRSRLYCHADLSEPWSLEIPAIPDSITFHLVTSGACWIRPAGASPVELRGGDLALVLNGQQHDLLSSPDAEPGPRIDRVPQEHVSDRYSQLRYGGSGRAAQLIYGVVSFEDPAARELMRTMPPVLIIRRDSALAASFLRDTTRLMSSELARPRTGEEAVATRLADILVVQALRCWIATEADATTGWLRALQDERIGKALEAIHSDPSKPWTLEQLAEVAGMARSSFTARFSRLVGEPPIAYLIRWRMNLALTRLREDDVPVACVAQEAGYHSEAAFSRAFTRVIGRNPGAVRRDYRPRSPHAHNPWGR